MRVAGIAFGLTLALAGLAPLAAEAAAHPGAVTHGDQREQVASAFIDEWFAAVDFKRDMQEGVTGSLGKWYFVTLRPEWRAGLNEAISDELDAAGPTVRAIIARQLAKEMTLEELQAGLLLVRDPGMAATFKATHDRAAPPGGLPPLRLDAQRVAGSPAGVSFAHKMDRIGELMAPVQADLTFTVIPGVLRRFGEKTAAIEARQRTAAR